MFIGRPVLWGLAHSGEEGVGHVLKLLNDELVMAMKLAGAVTLAVSNGNTIGNPSWNPICNLSCNTSGLSEITSRASGITYPCMLYI